MGGSAAFTASNVGNNATLTVRRGELKLGGTATLTLDSLVANGGNATLNKVTFNGGTLNTKATDINNATLFTVGNGTSAAALVLNGGSHSFANGLAVSAGATLGGNGTIGGATTINGILSPGNSIGTLNIAANTTWAGAATAGATTDWKFELDAGNTSDLLNITGNFLKNTGAGSVFRFDFAASTATGTFKLIDWSGTTGFSATDFSYTNLGGGNTGTFAFNDTQLELTVVPEPATWALLAFSMTTIMVLRRRRRQE
jgi:hypothetical protein